MIADIFTRAEVAGESHFPAVRAEGVSRAGAQADVLCVHFTGTGGEHDVWLADGRAGAEADADGLSLSWERGPKGVIRGRVCLHGAAVAEALLLPPAPALGQRFLRDLGLSRCQASALARWLGRPTLATFSRGPALSRDTQRRVHRALLASLFRWQRLSGVATSAAVA